MACLWWCNRNAFPNCQGGQWLSRTWKQPGLSPLSSFLGDIHPLKQKVLLSVLKWISFLCGMTFSLTISITPVCKVFLFFQYNCLTLLHLRMPPNFKGSAKFISMLQILTRTLCKMRPKDQLLRNCLPCFLPASYSLPSHCLQPVSCSLQFS